MKGRNCSIDYILNKNWASNINEHNNSTIYIVGGLYGNFEALKTIKDFASNEDEYPLIIFNGDIHWFDIYEDDFLKVENLIKNDIKLLGNVEYELINPNNNLGCGCNYPEDVDDEVVERSNDIHSTMKDNLKNSSILNDIRTREKTYVLEYLGKKIAITHGDEKSLSGWDCSIDSLKDKNREQNLNLWLEENKVDFLVTTHTCLPVVKKLNKKYVLNNGSSGMANIKGTTYGIFIRISNKPCSQAIISIKEDNIYLELVKVDFNVESFINWFDNIWNSKSPASISYRNRILNGTNLEKEEIII